jgi:hypothetical protein
VVQALDERGSRGRLRATGAERVALARSDILGASGCSLTTREGSEVLRHLRRGEGSGDVREEGDRCAHGVLLPGIRAISG